MKITCESCNAQYDLDESRIPASGVQMKCPACLHQFTVRKPGAGAPPPPPTKPAGPKEIALSDLDEDLTPLPPDVPGMAAPPPSVSGPSIALSDSEVDLPAPKAQKGA